VKPSGPDSWPGGRALRRSCLARAARLPAFTLLVAVAGCVTPDGGVERRTLAGLEGPIESRLGEIPERDRGLWEYRLALAALRENRPGDAAVLLDTALRRAEGVLSGPDANARRARSLFSAERTKTYIGEPYERAMAYFYRGLLYWQAGELDNARASFRAAQFADADADDAEHRGDYVLLDYLDGLASERLGGDGSDAIARAAARTQRELPAPADLGNALFVVEFGAAPRKVAAGDYGEKLTFRSGPTRAKHAVLTIGGHTLRLEPWDDLHFQATTRGDRVMDYILGNKAVFKEGADAFGDVALIGAQIAAENIYKRREEPRPPQPPARREPSRRNAGNTPGPQEKAAEAAPKAEPERDRDAERAALALGVIGVISKIASVATIAEADTRTWDNLPQYLSFGSIALPPGEYEAELEFLDSSERRIGDLSRRVLVQIGPADRDSVILLGEQAR
jgi:hypothetical protein